MLGWTCLRSLSWQQALDCGSRLSHLSLPDRERIAPLTLQSLLLIALCGSSALPLADDASAAVLPARAGVDDPNLVEGSFRIDRGPEGSLWVPPGEHLEFEVGVDLGVLGEAAVGNVTMSSGVEPYVAGLPRPGESPPSGGEFVGWVRIGARGGHLGYELDHTITTRYLPQEWPSLIHSEVQTGSENRKREVKVGRGGEGWKSTYRGNSHCPGCKRREHFIEASLPWNKDYHCKKCKRGEHRLWNPPIEREVPAQSLDILSAVYLARNVVRGERADLQLNMLQKEHLWKVKLVRGELRELKVPAGIFLCREVQLSVSQDEGEAGGSNNFSGLFGIKGALKIWLHEGSGIPVLIEGDVPVGDIVDLHANVRLTKFRGTPPSFRSLR